MEVIIYCKDCSYSICSGTSTEGRSNGRECLINVLNCPNDYDFCSRAVKQKTCPQCGKRFDKYPNFCPNCGADMREV